MSCRKCDRARAWWRGVLGLGKVASRKGIAPRELIDERRRVCRECPKSELSEKTGEATRCRECGCFLYAKTQLIDVTCPQGRW